MKPVVQELRRCLYSITRQASGARQGQPLTLLLGKEKACLAMAKFKFVEAVTEIIWN